MIELGKQVCFLKTGEGNPRNGEGTFARLKNGDILHVYTEYYGTSWEDEAIARLSAVISKDEGESWSAPYILMEKDADAENYMSPSLFRLPDGGLGMAFLRKHRKKAVGEAVYGQICCMPVFTRSDDEGKTWSPLVNCGMPDGYYCAINDGAIVQKNGRILVPMSSHDDTGYATVVIVASEDNGKTWARLSHEFETPFAERVAGLAEPGLYEHEDGSLWMWCRTTYGHQYQSRSFDNGVTWTPVEPNLYFTSPDSPMRVKKVGQYTLAVFNPQSCNCTRDLYRGSGSIMRTPFVCALSTDDGKSFDTMGTTVGGKKMRAFTAKAFLLESAPDNTYCYPSILETKDGFVVGYYHSNGGTYTLASTKIAKVTFAELEENGF